MYNLFSAQGAYGYSGNSLLSPGGTAMTPEQPGVASQTSPFGRLPITWNNPLFWLLILFLVWTGYICFGFNFGVKKVFKESFSVGG